MGVPVQLGASPQVLPLPAGDARSESTRSKSSIESELEEGIVDEVEMLLEAYFMPVTRASAHPVALPTQKRTGGCTATRCLCRRST